MTKSKPTLSLLNLLLIAALAAVSFGLVYQQSQMASRIEAETESVHFGWGTLRSADARIRMATISVQAGSNLTRDHRLELLNSLDTLIKQQSRVNEYVHPDPTRSLKYSSQILKLLGITTLGDFHEIVIDTYGTQESFHWDKPSGTLDEDTENFLKSAIQYKDTAN